MRLMGLVIAATLATLAPGLAVRISAQGPEPSPTAVINPAPASAAEDVPRLNLPVSIDRIKEALAHPPAHRLRGLDEQAQFKTEVQEHRKLEDLIASLDFKSGPTPAGGSLMA